MLPLVILPLVRSARASALTGSFSVALLGAVAGAVRLMPWLLDPGVPWRVAAPFARGLAVVALEAALVVGWPVGWTLACFRSVESGEARVLQAIGEDPAATLRRFASHGAVLALALGVVAMASGNDANAPGRMATELLARARASCAGAPAPTTHVVPFTGMAWLCAPGREPRLAGTAPGAMGTTLMTARNARIAGDFRALELDDARLALSGDPPVSVHVGTLGLRGMAPWAHASTLAPALRALLLALSAWGAAIGSAYGVLRQAVGTRAGEIVLGAAGPIAALGLLRALERADARPATFVLVPLAAWGCTAAGGALLLHAAPRLRRLGELAGRKSRC
jgi:hypothetical protein